MFLAKGGWRWVSVDFAGWRRGGGVCGWHTKGRGFVVFWMLGWNVFMRRDATCYFVCETGKGVLKQRKATRQREAHCFVSWQFLFFISHSSPCLLICAALLGRSVPSKPTRCQPTQAWTALISIRSQDDEKETMVLAPR